MYLSDVYSNYSEMFSSSENDTYSNMIVYMLKLFITSRPYSDM